MTATVAADQAMAFRPTREEFRAHAADFDRIPAFTQKAAA